MRCTLPWVRCAYPGYDMHASAAEELHRIPAADLRLLFVGQVQPLERFDGAIETDLRIVRAEQHVVEADVAQGPQEFFFHRGIGDHQHGGGDVEIEILEAEAVGGACEGEDVPEAEVQAADVREDEVRLRHAHHQVEQLLAVAGQDVGVVHQHGDAEFAGAAREGFDAGIGHIEVLGVGVDLQHLHAGGGDAGEFGQGGVAVVGMHGGDGEHIGVLRRQCDDAVVAGADLRQVTLSGLMGTTEPHDADAGEFEAGGAHVVAVLLQRGLAVAQVHVDVEHRGGGEDRRRYQVQRQDQGTQHASSHKKGDERMVPWVCGRRR